MGIYLYPPDFYYSNYAIADHGIAELMPKSCVVKEIAAGDYSLTMVHPYDPGGKWKLLTKGQLIRSPVPKTPISSFVVPGTEAYQTIRNASLYSRVRTTALENALEYQIAYNALGMQWDKRKQYYTDDYITYGFKLSEGGIPYVFRATEDNKNEAPIINATEEDDTPWENLGKVEDWEYSPDDGVVIATIPRNEIVMKIGDFVPGFAYIERENGTRGFVQTYDLEETESTGFAVTTPDGFIEEQFFRIYELRYNDADRTVTAQARHVSYDQRRNALFPCNLEDETAQTAIANIVGKRADSSAEMMVYSNLDDDGIDADWSFENPIQALLDPDEGLAGKTGAKIIRDNNVFYVMKNMDNSHGYEILYGKNLIGVVYTTNDDEVITREMPVADDGFDGYLFIDDVFVDASNIEDYPFPRVETLQSEYYVGQEIKKANGTTKKLEAADVQAKMLKEAQKRFSRDKVHQESAELDVDFLMLGDTEEYKQFRGMQTLCMYDSVIIKTGPSEMTFKNTCQVTGYEYDAILKRYNRIQLTKNQSKRRKNKTRNVVGFMIEQGSISYTKLSRSATRRIKRG